MRENSSATDTQIIVNTRGERQTAGCQKPRPHAYQLDNDKLGLAAVEIELLVELRHFFLKHSNGHLNQEPGGHEVNLLDLLSRAFGQIDHFVVYVGGYRKKAFYM